MTAELATQVEARDNPAISYLENHVLPLVGPEITSFWVSQADTWSQRFQEQSLATLIEAVGEVPLTKANSDKEALPALRFKLEHWVVGGEIDVASNLAIAFSSENILRVQGQPERHLPAITDNLRNIGGAQARLRWEKNHLNRLRRLERSLALAENPETKQELESQLEQAQVHYNSPLSQLNFLQRSQRAYVANRLTTLSHNPSQFFDRMKRQQSNAFSRFNRFSQLTNTTLGRDDSGFFNINYYRGLWPQLGLVEEPTLESHTPKGISVVFYRFNKNTGEKEFFLCYGKRDAFARTHHFTPTWQTSMTRVQQGNHPNQPYNPTLARLQEAFQNAEANNGVDISYLDLNANRNASSPIAVATIDFNSYPESEQQQIIDILTEENKGDLKHAWISEEVLARLGRSGLLDKKGIPAPALNGFLGIAIGRRSPKEIQLENVNRRALSAIQAALAEHPNASLAMILEEIGGLITETENSENTLLLQAIIQTVLTQVRETQSIHKAFPHKPHQLPTQTSSI